MTGCWSVSLYLLSLHYNLLITLNFLDMKQVDKFFGLQVGESQSCKGYVFECTGKKVLTKGAAPTLYGILTTPAGEVVDYTQKGVFANKLNKLAGVASSVTFPAKVDNSQQKGENKVVSVGMSKSKQEKRFLKAYKLCKQASEVYGLTDVFSGILEQLQQLDSYVINCEQVKAQQAIEAAKAEAEAKAKAEEEAKELQKAVSELQDTVERFVQCGMTRQQAEQLVRNNPNYTNEQKDAAFN